MKPNLRRRRQRGFSLIEVLVTVVITAFGLLGLAGFVARATALTADGAQRARASALLRDMTSRIDANRKEAGLYVTPLVYGEKIDDCSKANSFVRRDLCEWNNLLAGANELQTDAKAAHFGFRGCVRRPNDPTFRIFIIVAWGSIAPGVPPADSCGTGVFGDEAYRRSIRSQVRVAVLGPPT